MRIALVAYHLDQDASPGPPDGAGTTGACPHSAEQAAHLRGLGKALAARGHQVTVYARRHAARLPDTVTVCRDLTTRYITAGPADQVAARDLPSYLGTFGTQLAGWLRRTAPDVVHAYHWTSGLAALAAAREHDAPVIQTFGSLALAERRAGSQDPQDGRRLRLEACIGRTVAGVLAASSAEADDLASLGVPGSRVRVVPPGVDPARFGQGKPGQGKATWRRGGRPRLLYVGPLDAGQRVQALVPVLAELPGAELVIMGTPAEPATDEAARARLGKAAAEHGVADRITFADQAADAELRRLLRSSSVLVSAARHEPLGMAAIGAMASGLPVAATSVGAHADAVIHGTTGLLVPPSRPWLLGQALRDLLANPVRAGGYGIAAADRAASRYSWDRIGAEAEAAYEHVLSLPAGLAARAAGHPAQAAPGPLAA